MNSAEVSQAELSRVSKCPVTTDIAHGCGRGLDASVSRLPQGIPTPHLGLVGQSIGLGFGGLVHI